MWDIFDLFGGMGFDPQAMPAAARLSPRQQISFNHLADLYSPTIVTTGNKRLPGPYVLAEEGVRCHREIKRSADVATLIGRVESDIADSTDVYHFAEDQVIDDNWIIIDRSINPRTGGQGNSWGRIWMCRGQPQRFMASQHRESGKTAILASQEKYPPAGLVS